MCGVGEDASTLTGGVLNNVHRPFYLASGVSDRLALFYRYRLGHFCGTPAHDVERLVEDRSTQWSRGVCPFLRAALRSCDRILCVLRKAGLEAVDNLRCVSRVHDGIYLTGNRVLPFT